MLDSDLVAGPLQTSVHQRLDDLTRSAGLCDAGRATQLARREIPLLVQALRSVLDAHEPDEHGRCPVCRPPARLRLRRRTHLPCRAYLAVQLRLGTVEAALPSQRTHGARTTHLHSVS